MSGPKTAAGEAFRHDLTLGGWPWDDATRRIVAIEGEGIRVWLAAPGADRIMQEAFHRHFREPRSFVWHRDCAPVNGCHSALLSHMAAILAETADAAPAEPQP